MCVAGSQPSCLVLSCQATSRVHSASLGSSVGGGVNLSLALGSSRGGSRVQGFLVPSSKKLERWRTKTAIIQGAEEKQIISAPGLAAQLSLLQVNAELVFSVPTESLDH